MTGSELLLENFLQRLSEWDVLNMPIPKQSDGPFWQREIVLANVALDLLLAERDEARRELSEYDLGIVPMKMLDKAEAEVARLTEIQNALDQAAYYYRRELKEILQDCYHDTPDITKIKERAETAIRAADAALASVGKKR